MRKFLICTCMLFVTLLSLHAQYNSMNVPDSSSIRKSIVSSWITAPFTEVQVKNRELHTNDVGELFQVRMEEGMDEFLVIVAPQTFNDVDVIENGKQSHTERQEEFRAGSPGGWVLYRDKQSGDAKRIVWYFNADAEVYIQFRPSEGNQSRCYADMLVFGSYAARSVPVGVAFSRIYTASFSDIYTWTRSTLPWKKVTAQQGVYRDSVQVAETIKSRLGFIDYAENASYNEYGILYDIMSGNPINDDSVATSYADRLTLSGAGFLKWIIDGFVTPLAGRGTSIPELLNHTVDYGTLSKNGVLSQERNLSFSLDWTRNLAATILSVRTRKNYTYETGGTDVTIEPFAADVMNGMVVQSSGYIPNTGYAIKKLKSLLYVLAVTEPSYMYLAAIRQSSTLVADEMVFNECAVLIPYFDDFGRFGCYVFEKGRQIPLERFILQYPNSFVHLSRVKTNGNFFPQ